ncbi:hypothetical protein [Deinococcus yavapaiensis]|uniref:Cell division protein FtsL n=1 Tax=Deinococcus yavapaiensis KR-236 TaxID=694435 RepID=A0A318S7K5_9DEIO|nr:hypothetical protein [Deinococcus yavapaiensis]PYE54896.1 hypothetical protein DES52_104167 [Deinococcus yavapaiensis KR-236]
MTSPVELDEWRARALRYTLIYVVLAVALMGLRFTTRDIRPALLTLRDERATLQAQKRDLQVALQTSTSAARVRNWALDNGMIDFARAKKETASFEALPPPPALPEHRALEVTTQWR